MSPQQPDTGEVLAGLVERVTYHNAENGFCVLRTRARSHRDVVTVVGHAAAISAGEWIMASGQWVNDRTHGQQFKARFLRTSAPTSVDGIEKYLSSGMIRGVGPVYAKKLVLCKSAWTCARRFMSIRPARKPITWNCCSHLSKNSMSSWYRKARLTKPIRRWPQLSKSVLRPTPSIGGSA
jgi:ATP-dependent exoDNAse (exonuclease V) alpha subunit